MPSRRRKKKKKHGELENQIDVAKSNASRRSTRGFLTRRFSVGNSGLTSRYESRPLELSLQTAVVARVSFNSFVISFPLKITFVCFVHPLITRTQNDFDCREWFKNINLKLSNTFFRLTGFPLENIVWNIIFLFFFFVNEVQLYMT